MLAASHHQEGFMPQKDIKDSDINTLRDRHQIKSRDTFEEIYQEILRRAAEKRDKPDYTYKCNASAASEQKA